MATGFQRARRLAAEKLGRTEPLPSYDEAIAILYGPGPEPEAEAVPEPEPELDPKPEPKTREERMVELDAMHYTELKELLEGYGLAIAKPKNQSWDEYAIPLILEHEGY